MTRFKIGDIVETINGIGIIDDIRYIHGKIYYLIRTHNPSGWLHGGYSDFYTENEFQPRAD